MAETSRQKTLRDLWRVVFRHRYLFLLGAALVALVVLIVASTWPLKYTGTARFERKSPPVTEGGAGGAGAFETYKSTLRQYLAGRTAVEAVIVKLKMDQGLPHDSKAELLPEGRRMLQEMVRSMQKNIEVSYEVKSEAVDVIAVSYTSDDPWAAQKVPNALVNHYIEQILETIKVGLETNLANIEKSWSAAKTKYDGIDGAKTARMEFEKLNAGKLQDSNSLGEQIIRITADVDELGRLLSTAQKNKTRLEQLAADAKVAAETKTGEEPEPTEVVWGPNPDLAGLKEQLRKAKEELDIAVRLKLMTDDHPIVQGLKENIARIEERIKDTPEQIVVAKRFTRPVGPSANPYAVELTDAQSQIEALSDAVGKKTRELERLQALLAESVPLRQEQERLVTEELKCKAEADHYQGQLRELKRSLDAEMAKRRTNLYPMDEAQEQYKPSSPVLWQVLVIALIAGLAFGAGLVFLVHSLDRSITTTEEAMAYFDVPIYGVVGEIRTPRDLTRRHLKNWVIMPVVAVIIVIALAVATLDIVLYLEYPDRHQDWRGNPVKFVFDYVVEGSAPPAARK